MSMCSSCTHFFEDNSVGYYECLKEDEMSDMQFEEYEKHGYVSNCPYYEPSQYTEEDESLTLADFLEYEERKRKIREGHIYVDDPGQDWPDENWPTISEYEIHKKGSELK